MLTRYRTLMAEHFASPEGVFVFDDTGVPKRGSHSVGVSHQYCGALGKRANCQVAVTVHYSSPRGHFPLDLRLHRPESWTGNAERMDAAGVPQVFRTHRTKGEIALALLDRARAEGIAGGTVVADLGYGGTVVRDGLAARGRHYVLGIQADCSVFPDEPGWVPPARAGRRGPLPKHRVLGPNSPPPVAAEVAARGVTLRRVSWRTGTKGRLSARFGWAGVWPGQDWKRGACAGAEPLWLLVEARDDGEVQYAVSNLPPEAVLEDAVRVWKQRWRIEHGHQQMKEELGLDHFEGRSWRGFHHHAAMVLLAYGFLLLEQNRPRAEPTRSGKRGHRAAGDRAGHSPRAPATAPAAGQTRLPLLP